MEQTKTFIEFWRGLDIHSREELRDSRRKDALCCDLDFQRLRVRRPASPAVQARGVGKIHRREVPNQRNILNDRTMQTIILIILACITGFLDFLILLYIAKSLLQARADDRQGLIPTLICFILNTIVAVALILKLW